MKLAVFTDIHGNLEALKAIINDINSKNVDEIICLGDTIGLGSESKECLDLIIENNIKMVLGNHELCALYGTDIDSSINSNVQKEHYKWIRESLTTKEIDFLKKCPLYYECNISYNNIIKNKKIIFSHYLLEDTSKLYPFEKTNLKEDINLWIKYNNEDITYIVGHLHKSFNENEVDGISGDYIEAIDELTNIFILDSSGCTIDNDKLDKLEDIREENLIWIIYIIIIILSYYANSKEKQYLLYNDEKARREYQSLLIIIFSILVIIYYHFTKSSYDDILKLNSSDTTKKIILTKASFIGTLLVLISGIIFLTIAINDENIDVELAFN